MYPFPHDALYAPAVPASRVSPQVSTGEVETAPHLSHSQIKPSQMPSSCTLPFKHSGQVTGWHTGQSTERACSTPSKINTESIYLYSQLHRSRVRQSLCPISVWLLSPIGSHPRAAAATHPAQ